MGKAEECVGGCCCCCAATSTAITVIVYCIIYVIPILICVGLGLTMIIVAAIYFDDCPYQDMVVIWLIVGAIIPFILLFFMIMAAKDDSGSLFSCWRVIGLVVLLAFLGWLIAGSVWVLTTYTKADEGCSGSNCCAGIVMTTSLIMLVAHWVFFALAMIILLYIICKVCFCAGGGED